MYEFLTSGSVFPAKRTPNRSAEPEVLAFLAGFVVERGLERGDQAAAALDELAELLALGVGERGNVRQDEQLESFHVFTIEQLLVHHVKRNAGLDQGVGDAELAGLGFFAADGR